MQSHERTVWVNNDGLTISTNNMILLTVVSDFLLNKLADNIQVKISE